MPRKILIYSIPFGFGPTGKAIILANYLRKIHDVKISTFSHSLHLLKKSTYGVDVFDCHSRNVEEWDNSLFENVDTFISVMDLQAIRLVKTKYPHIKTIFIDSLLSWRLDESLNQLLEDTKFVDCYIAQYFPGIEDQILQTKYHENIHVVAPLLDKNFTLEYKVRNNNSNCPTEQVSDSLLIHYGGLSSPVIDFDRCLPFLEKTTEIIIKEFHKSMRLIFAGNIKLMKYLRVVFNQFPDVEFDCFSHSDFQEVLSQAKAYITTPGVESSYESFFWKKPTVFLPPTNSTQLHQINKFLEVGCLSTAALFSMEALQEINEKDVEYRQKTLELCDFCNKISAGNTYQEMIISDIYALTSSERVICKTLYSQESFVPSNLENGLCLLEKILEE